MHIDSNPSSKDVIESLHEFKDTEAEEYRKGDENLLELMPGPELQQSFTVEDVKGCYHISSVKSNKVWVNDNEDNFVLTNTKGDILNRLDKLYRNTGESNLYDCFGIHTVNNEGELIYIESSQFISKLSKDMKMIQRILQGKDSALRFLSVHSCPSTGDLLVGMYKEGSETGNVIRTNKSGELIQTIPHENTGLKLYMQPNFITENNNGDIVVSDSGAIVVTDRGGTHRFSYTGNPPGIGLRPIGICTDALSHILMCDDITKTVQILNRDGQFLCNLLTRPSGINSPHSLSYDVKTNSLWVGSRDNNNVCVYSYIHKRKALRGKAEMMIKCRSFYSL